MSSGRTHAQLTLACATPMAFVTGMILSGGDFDFATRCAIGAISGVALSPDLDQEGLDFFEHRTLKYTMGYGAIWLAIFTPYALAIPHRNFLSHFPVIGTAIRMIYLAVWLACNYAVLCFLIDKNPVWPSISWYAISSHFIGLAIADALHFLADGCPVHINRPPQSYYDKVRNGNNRRG